MAMSFNIGDEVYVRSPDNWDEWPTWTDEMEDDIDQDEVYTIGFVSDSGFVELNEFNYSINTNWLRLVASIEDSVSRDSKYYNVIRKIKQLNRKFEQRKRVSYEFI